MDIPSIVKHYTDNRQKLVKRASFRLGNDAYAEDAVQEAYERAIRYRLSFTGNEFDKWLNTILNNCLKDIKYVETGHVLDLFEEEEAEGTQCPSYPNHVMREVHELIATKGPIHQEILNMHFKYEYSPIDISRLTLHSYANCHKVVSRFRQELRELYHE
jgi:DNA-directed RNA polymerase specialized sigma24 family protein